MARNWLWAPASYRGVLFYVRTGSPSGGRRLVVHEYPGAEEHDVEDMGRLAGRFSVTAYIRGERTDVQVAALIAAMDQEGSGLLTLPMFGAKLVRPEKWSPSWAEEQLNAVAVQIDFVEEGTAKAPAAIGLALRLISGLAGGLPGALGGAVSALFQAAGPQSFAYKDAADALVGIGATVETLRTSLPVPDEVSRLAGQAVSDAVAELTGTALQDPGGLLTTILLQLDNIVAALPEDSGAETLSEASGYSAALAASAIARARVSEEGAAVYTAAAVMIAAETIRILAGAPYSARPEAIAARERMDDIAAGVLPLYGDLGPDIVSAFNEVWGTSVEYLAQTITTLAPIMLVDAPRSLPSTALAYRLYDDPARAVDLVARNQVATPFLMPPQFEAPSR